MTPAADDSTFGTFYPNRVVFLRGNTEAGAGYSALGEFGDGDLTQYGPLSPFRTATAPIVVYTRGYNGEVRPFVGNTVTYPNLPVTSPAVYPTRANVNPRIRRQATPPAWDSAVQWNDFN